MLWGWIDTLHDNYPCVPPYPVTEDSKCLEWELVETLFSVLNKAIPSLGDLLFKQVRARVWVAAALAVCRRPRAAPVLAGRRCGRRGGAAAFGSRSRCAGALVPPDRPGTSA